MSRQKRKSSSQSPNEQPPLDSTLFPQLSESIHNDTDTKEPDVLKLRPDARAVAGGSSARNETIQTIPQPLLPTRWEYLQPELEDNKVSLRTIIRPIPEAMQIIRSIIEYLRTTKGCQVLVIRADTGSGKTTFLNTLPHYMQDVTFHLQTIDLQPIDEHEFGERLWKIETPPNKINLIVLLPDTFL
ncbi:MAG: hypothetical protein U0822_28500 [Anaerolineae bacterium]